MPHFTFWMDRYFPKPNLSKKLYTYIHFLYVFTVIITKPYCHNITVYKNLTEWFLISWPASSVTLNQSRLEEDWYSRRAELWCVRKLNSRSPYTQPGSFRKESSVTNVTDDELRLSSVKSSLSSIAVLLNTTAAKHVYNIQITSVDSDFSL